MKVTSTVQDYISTRLAKLVAESKSTADFKNLRRKIDIFEEDLKASFMAIAEQMFADFIKANPDAQGCELLLTHRYSFPVSVDCSKSSLVAEYNEDSAIRAEYMRDLRLRIEIGASKCKDIAELDKLIEQTVGVENTEE